MKLMPMGDYYVWHCDWCDSTNQTVWTRFEKNDIHCTACQRQMPLGNCTVNPERHPLAFSYSLL